MYPDQSLQLTQPPVGQPTPDPKSRSTAIVIVAIVVAIACVAGAYVAGAASRQAEVDTANATVASLRGDLARVTDEKAAVVKVRDQAQADLESAKRDADRGAKAVAACGSVVIKAQAVIDIDDQLVSLVVDALQNIIDGRSNTAILAQMETLKAKSRSARSDWTVAKAGCS